MTLAYGQKIGPRTVRLFLRYSETLEKFTEGDRIRLTIQKDRYGKFNSLFHVMLSLLVKAVNSGPASTTIDDLKNWVKIQKGWYDVVPLKKPLPDGTTSAVVYRSTSFKGMGEDEFQKFAIDACDLIRNDLAPWVADSPEWQEAMQILKTIEPERET